MSGTLTRRELFRIGRLGAASGLAWAWDVHHLWAQPTAGADLILFNGRIATQDERRSLAAALALKDGGFMAVGTDQEVMRHSKCVAPEATRMTCSLQIEA